MSKFAQLFCKGMLMVAKEIKKTKKASHSHLNIQAKYLNTKLDYYSNNELSARAL